MPTATVSETVRSMNVLYRLKSSLRDLGVRATAAKLHGVLTDHWFDFRYGLDICPASELAELTVESQNKSRGTRYAPTRLRVVRRLFEAIEPLLPDDRVLVDIGSGKGRVLLTAAEFGFREARGIEFAHELCEAARRNCGIYKSKTGVATEFKIIEGDAMQYRFAPEENVLTLFNPFDDTILTPVVGQIAASLHNYPRKMVVVYYNPKWKSVFEQRIEFSRVKELDLFGIKCAVYTHSGTEK